MGNRFSVAIRRVFCYNRSANDTSRRHTLFMKHHFFAYVSRLRYIRRCTDRYDLIIVDSNDPSQAAT